MKILRGSVVTQTVLGGQKLYIFQLQISCSSYNVPKIKKVGRQ